MKVRLKLEEEEESGLIYSWSGGELEGDAEPSIKAAKDRSADRDMKRIADTDDALSSPTKLKSADLCAPSTQQAG